MAPSSSSSPASCRADCLPCSRAAGDRSPFKPSPAMLLDAHKVTKAFGAFKAAAKSLGTPGRKRLEIARALASEPKVLLLDEAMAGLTPAEIRTAIDLVRQIHGTGITLVIVEHIMEVIVSLADRVVVFHQGREISPGTPREVPSH